MENYKVVCIDDEADILDFFKNELEGNKIQVECFTDPIEAISWLKNNHKEVMLVFSDYKMGDFSGFKLKESLNKFASDIPFIIVTAYYDKQMAIEAMDLKIAAFLEKPVDTVDLVSSIHKYTEERIMLLNDEREMISGFIQEASPMLEEIEGLILDLEDDPENDKTLGVYFRLLHTIKGTASSIGLKTMGDYAHKYEDFINALRNKEFSFSTNVANVLLKGLDGLKVIFQLVNDTYKDVDFDLDNEIKTFDISQLKNQKSVENISIKNSKSQAPVKTETKRDDDKMTVSMHTLDEFMEESGELTVIRNTISKTVKLIEARYRGDEDVQNLNDLLDGMYKVTGNIQSKIVELRKVQLNKTFRPFKRLVRDISKDLNKEVDYIVEGEELFVDNIIAKAFSNTVIHLIRNSLDHGLESTDQRKAKGKNPIGLLKITAKEAGEEILLEIQDDGNGIDPQIIANKALEKGLYSDQEIGFMTEREVLNIIFDSGFSTAQKISDLSGRGVGMDMVKGTIEGLGGTIHVESVINEGSIFKIRIPVPKSVLIVNTLQVRVSDQIFKLQMEDVVEVIRAGEGNKRSKIEIVQGEPLLLHNNELLPIINLANSLGIQSNILNKDIFNIVVLRSNKIQYALLVDEIEEFEEVVSKKITEQIHSSYLYNGASIIGAGEVAMILSAEGLAKKECISKKSKNRRRVVEDVENVEDKHGTQFITFRSSKNRRYAVPLEQVIRLESIDKNDIQQVLSRKLIPYNGKSLSIIDPLSLIDNDQAINHAITDEMTLIVCHGQNYDFALSIDKIEDILTTTESLDNTTTDSEYLIGSFYSEDEIVNTLNLQFIEDNIFQNKSFNTSDDNQVDLIEIEGEIEVQAEDIQAA